MPTSTAPAPASSTATGWAASIVPNRGLRFNDAKRLFDPYAKAVSGNFSNVDNLLLAYDPGTGTADLTPGRRCELEKEKLIGPLVRRRHGVPRVHGVSRRKCVLTTVRERAARLVLISSRATSPLHVLKKETSAPGVIRTPDLLVRSTSKDPEETHE